MNNTIELKLNVDTKTGKAKIKQVEHDVKNLGTASKTSGVMIGGMATATTGLAAATTGLAGSTVLMGTASVGAASKISKLSKQLKTGEERLKKIRNAGKKMGLTFEQTKKEAQGVVESLEKYNKKLKKSIVVTNLYGKAALKTKKILKGFAVAAAASAAVITVSYLRSLKKAIDTASKLEEVQGKFNVVFAKNKEEAEKMSSVLVRSYAMSSREAKQYLSSVQDLLVPMGMLTDEAIKMSDGVVKLAADLGSFNNLPTGQVMADIQSALVGNFETMKKYGVILNETVVKQEALNLGLWDGKGVVDANTKAQVAYKLMLKDSAAAIGDQKRTMGSYANQIKLLKARTEELYSALGKKLLPQITSTIKELNSWLELNPQLLNQISNFNKEILNVGIVAIKSFGEELSKPEVQKSLQDLAKNMGAFASELSKNLPSKIDGITTSIKMLVDLYNKLPEGVVGAAGYGLIGKMLFGTKAGVIVGLIAYTNAEFKKFRKEIEKSGRSETLEGITKQLEGATKTLEKYKKGWFWSAVNSGLVKDLENRVEALKKLKKELEETAGPGRSKMFKVPDRPVSKTTIKKPISLYYSDDKALDAGTAKIEAIIAEANRNILHLEEDLQVQIKRLRGQAVQADIAAENNRYKRFVEQNGKIEGAETAHNLIKTSIYEEAAKREKEIEDKFQVEKLQIAGNAVGAELLLQDQKFEEIKTRYVQHGEDITNLVAWNEEQKKAIKDSYREEEIALLQEAAQTYNELGKSKFDIEREQLDELMKKYRAAGVEKNKIEAIHAKKSKDITQKENIAKLSIYQNTASGVVDTFKMIAEAGGRQSVLAFNMFKAFAIIEATIAAYKSYILAMSDSTITNTAVRTAMANVALTMSMVKVGLIASAQPPSYDVGGVSNAKGVYQTGNIQEAHVPIPSGKIPVELSGNSSKEINIVNNISVESTGDTSKDQEQARMIAQAIDIKIKQSLVQEQRPGGLLHRRN